MDVLDVVRERSQKAKSAIHAPHEAFDFIGFEFAGETVRIRQETMFKVKQRIAQFTQRSKERTRRAIERGKISAEFLVSDADGSQVETRTSLVLLADAIRRLNGLLGFVGPFGVASASSKADVSFKPGLGFVWNVLRCVSFEDVAEQFKRLDGYACARLRHLQWGPIDSAFREVADHSAHNRDLRTIKLRELGLRTFKDAANRCR